MANNSLEQSSSTVRDGERPWVFELTVEVGPESIDELGHVNNVEILRWVEQIGRAHLEATGFPLDRLLATGGAFVAKRHEIDYRAATFLGDRLIVRTRVAGMGGARSVRDVAVYREDTLVAEARTDWVYVDAQTMRPKRMPKEILDAFGIV
jgi:acyl-CoA thioester hydrolase